MWGPAVCGMSLVLAQCTVDTDPHEAVWVSWWVGGVLGLMPVCWFVDHVPSVNNTEGAFQNGACQCQCYCGRTSSPKWIALASPSSGKNSVASCLFRRFSKIIKWVWARLLSNYSLCAGTWSVGDFGCTLWDQSLGFYSPVALPNIIPAGFESRYSGGSSSQCRISRLGTLMWGLELSLFEEDLYSCDIPPNCKLLTLVCGS